MRNLIADLCRATAKLKPSLAAAVPRHKLFNSTTNVALKEGHLILEAPGGPYYWLFPASETKFFLRTEETEVEFRRGADGKVTEIMIRGNDRSLVRGPRIDRGKPSITPVPEKTRSTLRASARLVGRNRLDGSLRGSDRVTNPSLTQIPARFACIPGED
jgi:hypothetical protein